MSVNWSDGLDMLAQNGVLNYDASSYLKGTPPRYTVNQTSYVMPTAGPVGAPYVNNHGVPSDQFGAMSPKREKEIRNPLWKKIVWGGVLIATGGMAAKWLIKGGARTAKKVVTSPKYQTGMQNLRAGLKKNWKSIINFFKHPIKNTKIGIRKHPKLYKVCKAIQNFFKHPIRSIKNIFKKKP